MSSPDSTQESHPLLDTSDTTILSEDPPPLNNVNITPIDLLLILSGLLSPLFLSAIDSTVVVTLVSPIGSDFKKQSSYLVTVYLLSGCCFTPLYGRLSDFLGRKDAMLFALTLFGFGTIACGLAPSMEMFIIARAITGVGGGGIVTFTGVSNSDLVPLKQRGLYQGMVAAVWVLGACVGGSIGEWMNDAWGWRAAFLLQAPLLIMSFVLISLKVNMKLPDALANESTYSNLCRIDLLGSLSMVVSIASTLSASTIKTTEELPWSHPLILGLLTLSWIFVPIGYVAPPNAGFTAAHRSLDIFV